MKVHFDEQSDAVCFRLGDSKIVESEEVKPGLILGYNEKNEIVGFEILHAASRVPASNLRQLQFEVV
jgi:uncharacterized protein YuzE